MSNYNTRSRLYTVDYGIKGEKDKIGPTARRMKENNKNDECTVIPVIAAHCARSHSLRIFQQHSILCATHHLADHVEASDHPKRVQGWLHLASEIPPSYRAL
jgi:hypothetical protein